MKKGQGQGNQEASGAGWESCEATPAFNENERALDQKARERMEEDSVKGQGYEGRSGNAEAEPSRKSPKQVSLAHKLCRQRVPFAYIGQIMGVSEGTVNLLS